MGFCDQCGLFVAHGATCSCQSGKDTKDVAIANQSQAVTSPRRFGGTSPREYSSTSSTSPRRQAVRFVVLVVFFFFDASYRHHPASVSLFPASIVRRAKWSTKRLLREELTARSVRFVCFSVWGTLFPHPRRVVVDFCIRSPSHSVNARTDTSRCQFWLNLRDVRAVLAKRATRSTRSRRGRLQRAP
jgi:hypothetical protein